MLQAASVAWLLLCLVTPHCSCILIVLDACVHAPHASPEQPHLHTPLANDSNKH